MAEVLTTLERCGPTPLTKERFLSIFLGTGVSLLPLSNAHAEERWIPGWRAFAPWQHSRELPDPGCMQPSPALSHPAGAAGPSPRCQHTSQETQSGGRPWPRHPDCPYEALPIKIAHPLHNSKATSLKGPTSMVTEPNPVSISRRGPASAYLSWKKTSSSTTPK